MRRFILTVAAVLVLGGDQLVKPQSRTEQAAATAQMQPTPPPETASRVYFIGNRSFDANQLRQAVADQLLSIQTHGLSLPLADDTAYYLDVFYRRHGYPNVNVKYQIKGNVLELIISEGRYYNLGEIYFEGNTAFAAPVLKDYMIGTTRARVSQFQRQLPFVQADLETGSGLLQNYYISQGFPDAQVQNLKFRYDEARGAVDVVVPIKEGPKFVFGPITFTNDPGIPLKAFQPKIVGLTKPPQPYSQAALNTLQRDLTFVYKRFGHYTATVNVQSDIARARAGAVPVQITTEPGPVYSFGNIVVHQTPNARLRPDFLPKRFSELFGKVYDPQALQDLDSEMIATGLFDSLDIQETPEPDNTIRLTLNPFEAKPKEFGIFGGYDTFYGLLLGGNFTDRNIGGEGHIFSATVEYATRGPTAKVSYEDPWAFDGKTDLLLEGGIQDENLYGYTYVDEYGRLALTRKYGNRLPTPPGARVFQTAAFVQFKNANLSDITITPADLVGPTGYQILSVGLTQTIDQRDNPLNPRKGWILDLAASESELLQRSTSYLTLLERFSVYFPVGATVLGAGVRFGTILPSQGGTLAIPIEERFFNGGATTVRSFVERKLGPKDNGGDPVGGLSRSVFNIEDDFPIFAGIIGAVFFDAGGLGTSPFADFSTGIGLGLRYNLPVGPIRVDYGINPAPGKNDDRGAFNLSFGFAF
ncbi:MAG: BamA/TamA family outer membrane protein [Chthoniobacterales bacterium]